MLAGCLPAFQGGGAGGASWLPSAHLWTFEASPLAITCLLHPANTRLALTSFLLGFSTGARDDYAGEGAARGQQGVRQLGEHDTVWCGGAGACLVYLFACPHGNCCLAHRRCLPWPGPATTLPTLLDTSISLLSLCLQRARANDPTLHTDKTMFSCGSLAPKLQRGGGCIDHGFARWVRLGCSQLGFAIWGWLRSVAAIALFPHRTAPAPFLLLYCPPVTCRDKEPSDSVMYMQR